MRRGNDPKPDVACRASKLSCVFASTWFAASIALCLLSKCDAIQTDLSVPLAAMIIASMVAIVAILFLLSAIDIEQRLLPTRIVIPLMIVFCAFSLQICVLGDPNASTMEALWGFASKSALGAAANMALLGIPMLAKGPSLIGGGDVRLGIAIGLGLGLDSVLALGAACLLGVVWCAVTKSRRFPFGPFLALPSVFLVLVVSGTVLAGI